MKRNLTICLFLLISNLGFANQGEFVSKKDALASNLEFVADSFIDLRYLDESFIKGDGDFLEKSHIISNATLFECRTFEFFCPWGYSVEEVHCWPDGVFTETEVDEIIIFSYDQACEI